MAGEKVWGLPKISLDIWKWHSLHWTAQRRCNRFFFIPKVFELFWGLMYFFRVLKVFWGFNGVFMLFKGFWGYLNFFLRFLRGYTGFWGFSIVYQWVYNGFSIIFSGFSLFFPMVFEVFKRFQWFSKDFKGFQLVIRVYKGFQGI